MAPKGHTQSMISYELVRELGTRAVPTYAAHMPAPGGRRRLVVVETLGRSAHTSEMQAALLVRDARAAGALRHPNLARVVDVSVREDEILVASEFVEGELLSILWRSPATTPPLDVTLRILLDVAAGLSALHAARDPEKLQPLKLFHGELGAGAVVVGVDGASRVIRAARIRQPGRPPIAPGFGSIAPEVLSGGAADARSDVYSMGTLLWEALSGARLFEDKPPESIIAHVHAGDVPPPRVPRDAPWAAPLADVARRAMASAPEQRFDSMVTLSLEMRRIASAHVASADKVAEFLERVAGDKIAARRAALDADGSFDVTPHVPSVNAPPLRPRLAPASMKPPKRPTLHPAAPPKPASAPIRSITQTLRPQSLDAQIVRATTQQVVATGVAFSEGTLPAADGVADAIDLSDDAVAAPPSNPPPAAMYGAHALEAPTVPFFEKRAATFEIQSPPSVPKLADIVELDDDAIVAAPPSSAHPPPPVERPPPPPRALVERDDAPFASARLESLPPMRHALTTEPSVVMRARVARRRMALGACAIVAVAIGGGVGWRITEGAPDAKPIPVATQRPPRPVPTAPAPDVDPGAVASLSAPSSSAVPLSSAATVTPPPRSAIAAAPPSAITPAVTPTATTRPAAPPPATPLPATPPTPPPARPPPPPKRPAPPTTDFDPTRI